MLFCPYGHRNPMREMERQIQEMAIAEWELWDMMDKEMKDLHPGLRPRSPRPEKKTMKPLITASLALLFLFLVSLPAQAFRFGGRGGVAIAVGRGGGVAVGVGRGFRTGFAGIGFNRGIGLGGLGYGSGFAFNRGAGFYGAGLGYRFGGLGYGSGIGLGGYAIGAPGYGGAALGYGAGYAGAAGLAAPPCPSAGLSLSAQAAALQQQITTITTTTTYSTAPTLAGYPY
jgi:hypothetical protein